MSGFSTYRYLWAADKCEKNNDLSVTALALRLGVKKSMACAIVKDFEDKGYFEGKDHRHLRLSIKGKVSIESFRESTVKLARVLSLAFDCEEEALEEIAFYLLLGPYREKMVKILK